MVFEEARKIEEARAAVRRAAEKTRQAEQARVQEGSKQVKIQESAPLNTTKYELHVVKKNETIWEIQRRYPRATSRDILLLNNLTTRDILREGMKLKIPTQ